MLNRLLRRASGSGEPSWSVLVDNNGVRVASGGKGRVVGGQELQGYLAQLLDDGYASEVEGGVFLSWNGFYSALESPGYEGLQEVLGLPSFSNLVPVLRSKGSLTDEDFAISIAGWFEEGGSTHTADLMGAILRGHAREELMTSAQWMLVREIVSFASRSRTNEVDGVRRAAWGRIRRLALAAGARLDNFLDRTIVLTPDRLALDLRRAETDAGTVVEISPLFEGAPADWLERFDARRDVPERYDIPTERGIVQVLVSDAVRTVLREVKRMPGRRVAGARAEAFLLNPYAVLGEDAKEVIDEDGFAQALDDAGIRFDRFSPAVEYNEAGNLTRLGIRIESLDRSGALSSDDYWLSEDELRAFVRMLEGALAQQRSLLAWNGFDIELDAEAAGHLRELEALLSRGYERLPLIAWDHVYDLSQYSERIEGIGEEKPYYSPYIAKRKEDEGWFPENVDPYVVFTQEGESEPILIPIDDDFLKQLNRRLQDAQRLGLPAFEIPGLPRPISTSDARQILSAFSRAEQEIEVGDFDPGDPICSPSVQSQGAKRSALILRSNIQTLDYEVRRKALQAIPAAPLVPACLKPEFPLLAHQQAGLAWLQHLYSAKDEYQVRGCVLADDMGLGKTFQLLAFMAWLVENDPDIAPMLIVAPVSLLENWKEEIGKFLSPGALPLLTAYGTSLSALRVPKAEVDERLRTQDGLVNFLKPGWVGKAKVVLTTYETLRDLEFSFAAEHWSVMVCGEAQKIKNPAAMVTRAAKKQNVDFKIACTGTPVENSLADLWCLFDFIQPGLLGALDEFGKRYRKPIEAQNDDERARVEELRERIAPQILRRTKAEVAKDLPRKIEDAACQKLKLSELQRALYARAIHDFKRRDQPDSVAPFKNHLGLLHYLRLVCTDPRQPGLRAAVVESVREYRAKVPKFDWLLDQLDQIRRKGEKAIVFCEFREIQRLLQHYISDAFNYKPDIINGDTSAAAECADNRQRRIKAFQASPGFGVIILSPVAVGFGVNIQAANHVIHYTRTWNPAKEDQATDRAYRIGQVKDVYVYYPVVTAEDFTTFDVKLDELLRRKRALATDMLNGAGDLDVGDFNIAEVVPASAANDIDPLVDMAFADQMSGRYFEGLVGALWAKRGVQMVHVTPQSGDHGVDVVVVSGGEGFLIQVKHSSITGSRLGWDAVREVLGGKEFYRRKFPGVEFTMVALTNQLFNENAREHAGLNDIQLIERPELAGLLGQCSLRVSEVERFVYSSR